MLDPTKFELQKKFSQQKFWVQNVLDPKKVWDQQIFWEPNYPVHNFAQNKGKKLRHHPDHKQWKVVTNDKTGQNYSQGINLVMASVQFR